MREDIAKMRSEYLFWMEKYREDGYRVHYQDEMWGFIGK